MAQYRQSGMERYGIRGGHDFHSSNGTSDHVSIGIRSAPYKQSRPRRWARSDKARRVSIGGVVLFLSLVLVITILAYYYISRESKEVNYNSWNEDLEGDSDFLMNVTEWERNKVLKFGQGSEGHGRDSRYWDKDDRRRDGGYYEHVEQQTINYSNDDTIDNDDISLSFNGSETSYQDTEKSLERSGGGLYDEAGRHELKKYEAEYEASLKNEGQSSKVNEIMENASNDVDLENENEVNDVDDEDDILRDPLGSKNEDYNDVSHKREGYSGKVKSYGEGRNAFSDSYDASIKDQTISENVEEGSSLNFKSFDATNTDSRHGSGNGGQSTKKSRSDLRKRSKRHKFGSCEIKFLNSNSQLIEPLESRKFVRFSLQYTELEERPVGEEQWMPRFAGHQTLEEREQSFLARDKKINCGFVKGPKGYPSTGFDLSEDDTSYISRCHIAVISAIFGNSDRLRTPTTKTVTRMSRKNVCFVMFMDEVTLKTLSSEGQLPDRMGFIGFWKIVVVQNLPYDDMRRVGKIPKLLPHRLFPSARYSIWLDSKLRLQLDPLLILEYFLWRKGYEYAISNHYDRHCVWEEVAQNKKLNKYNHTIIDEQFLFYQADGLKRFNASDPNKLLPSNVPEGSFIIRAHTPMSNLFSCLWFNEVDWFTPRDQLSFANTYQKLSRMNPNKPFHLNMFKDCERRAIAKLFHHRSEEKRNIHQKAIE